MGINLFKSCPTFAIEDNTADAADKDVILSSKIIINKIEIAQIKTNKKRKIKPGYHFII